jgi:hypothetical protein
MAQMSGCQKFVIHYDLLVSKVVALFSALAVRQHHARSGALIGTPTIMDIVAPSESGPRIRRRIRRRRTLLDLAKGQHEAPLH